MTEIDTIDIPVAADPYVGRLLDDKYKIVRKLGEGGMGSVYEGTRLVINRRVAIKTLHPQLAHRADVVQRFLNEARAVNEIGHEHIIEIHDFGLLDSGAPYLVMEFLEGRDLSAELDACGPLPVRRACAIMIQVCEALAATHAHRIVHRDLKPENVFLLQRRGEDFVKVLDFGVSKFMSAESGLKTRSGIAMGTPYFMAPEQARGRSDLDHRADVYALGVMLYNLLTAGFPFEAESAPALLVKLLSEPPEPIVRRRTGVPREIVELIGRMLQKDPDDRPQSCDEVAAALAPFADERRIVPVTREADALAETMASMPPAPREERPVPVTRVETEPAEETDAPRALEAPRAAPAVSRAPLYAAGLAALLAIAGAAAYALRAPDVVSITVTAPTGATLFVDGAATANPARLEVEPSAGTHTIRAEREGFLPVEVTAVFDRDHVVELRPSDFEAEPAPPTEPPTEPPAEPATSPPTGEPTTHAPPEEATVADLTPDPARGRRGARRRASGELTPAEAPSETTPSEGGQAEATPAVPTPTPEPSPVEEPTTTATRNRETMPL